VTWKRLREIIQEQAVSDAFDEARVTWPRLDEAWAALEWLLARRAPDLGHFRDVDGTTFRLYKQAGDDLAKTPDITIVYSCTDDDVTIYDVRFAEPPAEP
jgi:hypothetical protein